MEVSASLATDAESLELMQPGEGALYYPTHLRRGTVGDAASGDQRFDAAMVASRSKRARVCGSVRSGRITFTATGSPATE